MTDLWSADQDQRARETIRGELEVSLLVEAAAGTGKTSELVRRLVAVLQSGKAPGVDRIVAVTFTRKAAGELKIRLREALDRAREGSPGGEESRNLERAIAHLEEARIGTIHSFCADLLRERPVEARVDPFFAELAEDEAPRFFEQAFREWIQEKLNDLTPGLQRILSRSLSPSFGDAFSAPLEQIRDTAHRLAEWRDFPAPWERRPFERELEIDTLVEQVRELADMSQGGGAWDPLNRSLRPVRDTWTWVDRWERERSRDYDRLEGLLVELLVNLRKDSSRGSGAYNSRYSRAELLEAREALAAELENFKKAADADLAALLQGELTGVVELYQQLKERAGRLDFSDLLIRTRDLLRDNDELRAYFQARFTHLFVDEFQDTDPLQAEILMLLAAGDPLQRDWRLSSPRPGKLFLVGDPKQSIYRFRRADVLLYRQVKEQLLKSGVSLVYLTRSFRSVRPIQDLVNASFQEEIREDALSAQPEYVPLGPVREQPPARPSLIVLPVPEPYGIRQIAKYRIEQSLPEAAASWIDWLLRESGWTVSDPENPSQQIPVAARHICLLFRRFVNWNRDVTRDYTRSLESRRIPHVLVGARSFHQREEVETVRVALTAVEWPDDELAVFGTLRGALMWVPDGILLRFREEVGRLHPFRPLPEGLDPSFSPVAESLAILAELHRRRNRRPIVETILDLLQRTRAHAGFAFRPAGHQVLANVQRICDSARVFESRGRVSFRAFVEQLTAEAERPTSSEAPVVEEGADGVRLMTVHAAKGLEFPVVLLADPTCPLGMNRADRHVDPERQLAAFSLMRCAPWDLIDHEQEEMARDQAEAVRLAYVAATRARDLLVIPAVGDQPLEGWLSPLNKAIYPPRERWRQADEMPGCPRFGSATVLQRPAEFDGSQEFSVMPGRHRPERGDHEVVWWDPAALELQGQPYFGVQREEILRPEGSPQVLEQSLRGWEEWQKRKDRLLEAGARPTLQVFTVTAGPDQAPPVRYPVATETLSFRGKRPSGPRFGTLVHTVLRDVDLAAGPDAVTRLAQAHGRVLGSPAEEITACVQVVVAALAHPLLRRAAASASLHREAPLLLPLEEKKMLEGTVDLAFLEEDRWVILDFKTDAGDARFSRYLGQLQWYLHAYAVVTGKEVEGYLFRI